MAAANFAELAEHWIGLNNQVMSIQELLTREFKQSPTLKQLRV